MKQVPFGEVALNQRFTYKSMEYIKENQVKISCCKFTNAHAVGNANQKIGIKANEMVEVDD